MSLKNFLSLGRSLEGMSAGDQLCIDGTEGHHGARVMRLRDGEHVLLTDETGHQGQARVLAVDKHSFTVVLEAEPSRPEIRGPRLTLVQALAKGGRDEQAVETATELGVHSVIPWQSERSVVQWRGDKADKGRSKWLHTVHTAVKQSRRATIPQVMAVMDTPALTTWVRELTETGHHVVVLDESASMPLAHALVPNQGEGAAPGTPVGVKHREQIAVIVGPEGGLTPHERRVLGEAGARLVRLGPEIMRTSSAGPAALAAINVLTGRWA